MSKIFKRYTKEIIAEDENLSIKGLCEKNKGMLVDSNLRGADLRSADLSCAYLRGADLRGADLRGADLRGADLTRSNLLDANLSSADLRRANLSSADLRSADLSGADLDFSCLEFSCKSLNAITDENLCIQLSFHFASWLKNRKSLTDEEKTIYNTLLPYVNKFHRTDVERLREIK